MACHAQLSREKGVHFSSRSATLFLVLASLYMAVSLAFTLTTRLYLKAYYVSAHVSGLSVFVGLFVLAHHVFRMHTALNCSAKAHMAVKTVWGMWCLLCCLVAAVAYSVLTTVGHVNFDYVAALAFAWVDVFFMIYILSLAYTGACSNLQKHEYDFSYGGRNIFVYTVGNDQKNATGTTQRAGKSTCSKATRCCCAVLIGIIFLLFHLLFALFVCLTAYHPVTTLLNIYKYQRSADMYTVSVEGHRPMSLFLRCRGNGSDTIVYENGLGAMAMMQWDFIPKILEDRYRVCVHDRRGYGWSEGYEWDNIEVGKQWAENNAKFFQALVKEAGISTPFYYIGHSYGGTHLAFNAFLYPETIKGLVFLDSAHFSPVTLLRSLLEVINNFRALGLLKIALDTNLLDYETTIGEVVNFKEITTETRDTILASISTGYYFSAFQSEQEILKKDEGGTNYPAYKLNKLVGSLTIDKPILVLDADSKSYFNEGMFNQYQAHFHYAIPGSDHQTLVYDLPYANTVSELIDQFIRLQNNVISEQSFVSFARNATVDSGDVRAG